MYARPHSEPTGQARLHSGANLSRDWLTELRTKLRTKLKLPKRTIAEIEAELRQSLVVKTPSKHLGLGISDPDDEWIVASAVAGGADVLVTGDAAVLKLGKRAPLPIVSPRGLWERLRAPESGS